MRIKYHESLTSRMHGCGLWWSITAALLTVVYGALALVSPDLGGFFVLMALAAALWLGGAALLFGRAEASWRGLFLWAIALRLAGLYGAPLFEDDWARYLWDGLRFATDGTPYGTAPEAYFTDPGVPRAAQALLSQINHPELPTIYGPTLQYLFLTAHWIAPAALWPLKLLLIAADLVLLALLARRVPPWAWWLYAGCPLVIKEIVFTAHPDGLGALLACSAVFAAASKRYGVGGALLALAVGVKFWALLLAPWVLRRWPALFAALAMLALLYLPFVLQGATEFAALRAFGTGWVFNAPLYAELAQLWGTGAARALCGGSFLVLALIDYARTRHAAIPRADRLFGAALLVAPVVNPWYLLWLLPWAALHPTRAAWTASVAVLASYAHGLYLPASGLPPYAVAPWALTLEYGVILVALLLDLRAGRRAQRVC